MAMNVEDYIEIVTENDIDKMNQLNDSMEKLCRSVAGEWQKLEGTIKSSTMADNFSQIGKILTEQADASRASIGKLAEEMGSLSSASNRLDISKLQEYHKTLKDILGVTDTFKKVNGLLKTDMAKFSSVLSEAVQYGRLGKNTFEGIADAFEYVSVEFNGFQKAAIGSVAVFAEFNVVKDSIYDIATGSGNAAVAVAKITAAVVAAGAAFSTVFAFPYGLVATGIVAAGAAIMGLNDVLNALNAKRAGEDIREAFENPGGISIEKLGENFVRMMEQIGGSFTSIADRSKELDTANSSIRDVWLEIEKIELSMESGVTSVEEGTQKLNELFGSLSDIAREKFSALENTLLSAFGENGPLSGYMQQLGVNTRETMQGILQVNDATLKRQEEINAELATMDPGNPRYLDLKQEMAELMVTTDDLQAVLDSFHFKMSSLGTDYTDLFDESTLNIGKLQNFLDPFISAIKDTNGDIEEAVLVLEISLQEELDKALSMGDYVSANKIQKTRNAIRDAMRLMQGDVRTEGATVAYAMQVDFMDRIDDEITAAQERWADMDRKTRSFYKGGEGEYLKGELENYVKNFIDPLSQELETAFAELGINGVGMASGVSADIVESLFETSFVTLADGSPQLVITLKENYQDIFNEQLEATKENFGVGVQEIGTVCAESFMGNGERMYNSAIGMLQQMIMAGEAEREPLIAMYNELGSAPVSMGLLTALDSMGEETKWHVIALLDQFKYATEEEKDGLIEQLKGYGIDLSDLGLIAGIDSEVGHAEDSGGWIVRGAETGMGKAMGAIQTFAYGEAFGDGFADGIYSKIGRVANVCAALVSMGALSIQRTQQSHSPSKLTRGLGTDFSEGYELGITDNEEDVQETVEGWMTRLRNRVTAFAQLPMEVEIARPEFPSVDYSAANIVTNTYTAPVRAELELGMEPYMKECIRQNGLLEEQNILLKNQNMLLNDIREKPVIQDSDVFSSYQRSQREFFARTGRVGISGID